MLLNNVWWYLLKCPLISLDDRPGLYAGLTTNLTFACCKNCKMRTAVWDRMNRDEDDSFGYFHQMVARTTGRRVIVPITLKNFNFCLKILYESFRINIASIDAVFFLSCCQHVYLRRIINFTVLNWTTFLHNSFLHNTGISLRAHCTLNANFMCIVHITKVISEIQCSSQIIEYYIL